MQRGKSGAGWTGLCAKGNAQVSRIFSETSLQGFLCRRIALRRLAGAGVATACLLSTWLLPVSAHAQSAENVAVIINDDSADSKQVGERFVRARSIPDTNVIRIQTPAVETISRTAYLNAIEGPIRRALSRNRLQDRVLYLVLTKGVPLRIEGTPGLDGTGASVDSELTLLYRRMVGITVATRGRVANPYFESGPAKSSHETFSHRAYDIYLVTRLDGFTLDDALALIDRAQAASSTGSFVLDQRGGVVNNPTGDIWLSEASRRLATQGLAARTVLESTREPARDVDQVLGYYSWASNDPRNHARKASMRFVAGAVAATFGGADARTFREPPAEWTPNGDWRNRDAFFEGAPTSLIGDLVREGVTGVAGHVADPFLQSAVRPDVLFPAYAAGMNLAEAFYLALPHLSWQTIVLGDPLCRPFTPTAPPASPLDEGIDDDTEMPRRFAARRLDALQDQMKEVPAAVRTLILRAESRLARDDSAGARQALEQAVELAPQAVGVQLQLATLYESEGDFDLAQPLYELVLKLRPENVIALNNLAYGMAVYGNAPEKARPLAAKAVGLAPREPTIADTLAWIEHLLGNNAAAVKLIAAAAKGAPNNKDIRLHAAFIYAAAQSLDAARAELKAALSLDPSLSKRDDVQELERRLTSTLDASHR